MKILKFLDGKLNIKLEWPTSRATIVYIAQVFNSSRVRLRADIV